MVHNQTPHMVKAIIEFGLIEKEAGKESAFVKFQTDNGPYTWFGSLKQKQPGAKFGAREITFTTMTKLGWDGDIDKFVNAVPCFTLPDGVEIVVGDDEYQPGKTMKDKVIYVNVPGYGSGRMDAGKGKSLLAGMKADIDKARTETALHKDDPGF